MTVQSTATIAVRHIRPPSDSELRDGLQQLRSRELVFAVVGYAGSGTSFVATQFAADAGARTEGVRLSRTHA